MRHLKLFEEHIDKEYKKLPIDDWCVEVYGRDIYDIEDGPGGLDLEAWEEVEKFKDENWSEISKFECDNIIKKLPSIEDRFDRFHFKYYVLDENRLMAIYCVNKYGNEQKVMEIIKSSDDYYYVEAMHHGNYKCDQFSGLIKCLEDIVPKGF